MSGLAIFLSVLAVIAVCWIALEIAERHYG